MSAGRPRAFLFWLLVAAAASRQVAAAAAAAPGGGMALQPVFTKVESSAYGVAFAQDRYYLADADANTIRVVDRDGRPLQNLGAVGSGKGELLHPTEVFTTPDGRLFVRDLGNERVEILDSRGRYRGEAHLPEGPLAVNSHGEMLVARPENGALVTVYDTSGKELRKFGAFKKTSDVYGPSMAKDDARNRLLINRVALAVTKADEVLVCFRFAPIVQKYSASGKLLWETRLTTPEAKLLGMLFTTNEQRDGRRKFQHVSTDDRVANLVLLGSAADEAKGTIYVLLPSLHLVVLDRAGQLRKTIKLDLPGEHPAITSIFSSGGGEVLLFDFFSRRIWRGIVPL